MFIRIHLKTKKKCTRNRKKIIVKEVLRGRRTLSKNHRKEGHFQSKILNLKKNKPSTIFYIVNTQYKQ